MKIFGFSLSLFAFILLFATASKASEGQLDDFEKALLSDDNETAAVVLHEILNSNPYNPLLWQDVAEIFEKHKRISQSLIFFKAALNLEKDRQSASKLKRKIEAMFDRYCPGMKIEYVVTYATVSVKLLKNIIKLPKPAGLEVLESGIRELPSIIVSTEEELESLEESRTDNDKVAYIDTSKNLKKKKVSKHGNLKSEIDNTVPVEKMPSYNQTELMKNLLYPEEAVLKRLQGTVIVKVFINSEGKPIKPEIKSSAHKVFNKAAMDAVLKTNYMPAKQNGQPVGCWMFITIEFVLK